MANAAVRVPSFSFLSPEPKGTSAAGRSFDIERDLRLHLRHRGGHSSARTAHKYEWGNMRLLLQRFKRHPGDAPASLSSSATRRSDQSGGWTGSVCRRLKACQVALQLSEGHQRVDLHIQPIQLCPISCRHMSRREPKTHLASTGTPPYSSFHLRLIFLFSAAFPKKPYSRLSRSISCSVWSLALKDSTVLRPVRMR